jgi:phosphoserine phosphatase RsbU/P
MEYITQAPVLFFCCKDDGTLLEVNDTLCATLGFSKDELLGKKVDEIYTLSSRIFHQTHFFPLIKMQNQASEIFITLQGKEKKPVPVLMNALRKLVDSEAVILHVGIEVQNRKKFEDELITAKKTAEAALQESTVLLQAKDELQQRMEQLDQQIELVNNQNVELRQFNRVITHDLQEPLRKLSFFHSMLVEGRAEFAQKEIVNKLIYVSEQMRAIVSGLQQYIWLTESAINVTTVELPSVLADVEQLLLNENPQVELIIKKDPLILINGDKEQIKVLLYQLLSNVVRFRKVENKAYVNISSKTLMLNKFKNLRDKYSYKKYLQLQIEDEGIGFDPLYKDQLFELFKRLHPISGRGIGLALCKKIIENHQGTITIDSIKGVGTTTTITLPIRDEELQALQL